MPSGTVTFETVGSPPTETVVTGTATFETTPAASNTVVTGTSTFTTTLLPSYTVVTGTTDFTTVAAGGVYRFDGTQWIKQLVYRFVNGAWRQL